MNRSSSVLGAGVGVAAGNRGFGDGGQQAGAGQQANSSQMTRTNSIGELHGQPVFGPQRPAHLLEYGNQGTSGWSFANLDATEADEGAERLMTNVDDHNDEDDAASTTAEMDPTGELGWASRMEEDFNGFEDEQDYNNHSAWSTAGRNSPVDDTLGWDNYQDDHRMYSDAHEDQDADFTALHLEDAGAIGGDSEQELPTVEIYPAPPTPERMEHDKID